MIREYFHSICCLFWWCVAFAAFASSPIILVFHDAMSAGIMLCISFMTWAMGLCFYDSALRIRQCRIEDEIIARYRNNG